MNEPGAPKAAVIGTGRCGTGYTAALLQANGVDAGHERWFRPIPGRVQNLDVDVSWLALPDIESGVWTGPIAMVIRHPVDVIRSLVGIDFFNERSRSEPFITFARAHVPEVRELWDVEAAVEFWVAWNRRCAAVADLIVKLDQLQHQSTVSELGAALGVSDLRARPVSRSTNQRIHRLGIDPARVWELLDGRASEFGYHP